MLQSCPLSRHRLYAAHHHRPSTLVIVVASLFMSSCYRPSPLVCSPQSPTITAGRQPAVTTRLSLLLSHHPGLVTIHMTPPVTVSTWSVTASCTQAVLRAADRPPPPQQPGFRAFGSLHICERILVRFCRCFADVEMWTNICGQ